MSHSNEHRPEQATVSGSKPPAAGKIVGVIFLFFSFIFGIISLFVLLNQIGYSRNGILVEGVVIRHNSSYSREKSLYAPVIRYEVDHKQFIYEGQSYSGDPYPIHEKVTMMVMRDDPQDAVIDDYSDRWLGLTILGGLFFVMLLIGVFAYRAK